MQSLRHSLRTLYACAEAARVVVRQGNLQPAGLCQAANICLQLHEQARGPCCSAAAALGVSAEPSAKAQSNSVAMKATLGRKAEAWTDVRQTLLDAARAAVQALIDHGMESVGPLTEDVKQARTSLQQAVPSASRHLRHLALQDLLAPHEAHRAVPRACELLGELLDDVAEQQLDVPGLRRLHMKLYCWCAPGPVVPPLHWCKPAGL